MQLRAVIAVGLLTSGVPVAVALSTSAGLVAVPATVSACSLLAVAVGWPLMRRWVHAIAATCGMASVLVTVSVVAFGETIDRSARHLGPVELISLYLLLAAVARWTTLLPVAVTAGAVVWIACVVWILRLVPDFDVLAVVGGCASTAVPATAAVVAGGLPRYQAFRRDEMVEAARREQRLELAHDLHDFVAHDLTGIVAQAQAARFVETHDPAYLRSVLERIETVGLKALDTMDHFVHVLHQGDRSDATTSGVADIPALVDRFREERRAGGPVHLHIDERLRGDRVPRESQLTAYRVVAEGLTNVRRHAAPSSAVAVSLEEQPDGVLLVQVTNDQPAPAAPANRSRRFGGTGLAALRERVAAVGGQLVAGPDGDGHWSLRMDLPIEVGGATDS